MEGPWTDYHAYTFARDWDTADAADASHPPSDKSGVYTDWMADSSNDDPYARVL